MKFFGSYTKKNQKLPLVFRNIKFLSSYEIEGFDNDDGGKFQIFGSFTSIGVKFTKEYLNKHKIEYEGGFEDSNKVLMLGYFLELTLF